VSCWAIPRPAVTEDPSWGPCCEAVRGEGERHVCPTTHLRRGDQDVVAYFRTRDAKQVQTFMVMGVLARLIHKRPR
jgi:hypothetical protein